MTDITIPPEALEAAARAIYLVFTEINIGDGEDRWERLQPRFRAEYREEARAACLAMLKAWPGMHIHEWQRPWLGGMSGTDIVLPLTKQEGGE